MMKRHTSWPPVSALLASAFIFPAAAADEPGKHSPYVIGPLVRDQAKRQIVIPVHYYWKKGDKNTNTRLELTIEFQGKSYSVDSSDTFVTSSQSGLQSVVSEFVIRDWRPGNQIDKSQALTELAKAAELNITFEGSADGVPQKASGTFPITDLPAESPEAPKQDAPSAPTRKPRR